MLRDLLLSRGGWLVRVITVTVLFAVIGLSIIPWMVSHVSTSAVVNAPVTVIRSPLEGVVEQYALAIGAPVAQGQDIAVLRAAESDVRRIADLAAQVAMAEARAAAVENRIDELISLRDALLQRDAAYAGWHRAVLAREVAESEARIRRAEIRLGMLARGAASAGRPAAEPGEPAGSVEEQAAYIDELEARLAARMLKLRALDDRLLAGTDGTNTPYTLQRIDEIEIEMAALRDEASDHTSEARIAGGLLAGERRLQDRTLRFAVTSPVSGVVWNPVAPVGRPVLPGDAVVEILDCGARFLEAYLPDTLIGTIAVGDLAEVRLTGSRRSFQAPVVSILGRGARFNHANFAARDDAPKARKMRVIIALDDRHAAPDPGVFCHVGRGAEVSFDRDLPDLAAMFAGLRSQVAQAADWLTAADRGRS